MKTWVMLFALALVCIPSIAQKKKAIEACTKAISYFDARDYDNTIVYTTEAISIDPKYSLSWFYRGKAYFYKNELDKAMNDLNESTRLYPKDYEALLFKGIIFHKKKDYSKAIEQFTAGIVIDPEIPALWINRGTSYFQQDENDKALSDFNKAIAIDSELPEAWLARGQLYYYLGEPEKALSDIRNALNLNESNAHAHSSIGSVYNSLGQYEKSISSFKRSLRIVPTNAHSIINIIFPLVHLQRFEEANSYYTEYKTRQLNTYINEEGAEFLLHYLDAVQYAAGNSFEMALKRLEQAERVYQMQSADSKLENSYTDVLAFKGFVQQKLNKISEAKTTYEQSLVLNKNQVEVIEALKQIEVKISNNTSTDATAPVIELISPNPTRGLMVSKANSIQVVGKAKDPSGISKITVNNIPVPNVEEDGTFIVKMPVQKGKNSFTVVATDKKGNTGTKQFVVQHENSEPDEIVAVQTDTKPNYYAILVAVKDYVDPSIPDLENTEKDALELQEVLEKEYSFEPKNVQVLRNGSRESILEAIMQKCHSLTENDNLLIFYAGHGTAEKDKFGDVDGYWIPASGKKGNTATYISSDDLKMAVKRSNAKHILVIADACFSGAFTRSIPSDASLGVQKQYSVLSRKIMASGNMEPVPDNSKFIYYLNKNLRENREKYLSAKKLYDSFYEAILNNTDTSPQYSSIKNVGDEGGEFIFIKK
jgi:tetratricopeptide (TPR) repeat protein